MWSRRRSGSMLPCTAVPASGGHRRFEVVDDPAVFCVGNFCDAQAIPRDHSAQRQPSSVVDLTAAGGIKRRFPQDDAPGAIARTRRVRRPRQPNRIRAVQSCRSKDVWSCLSHYC